MITCQQVMTKDPVCCIPSDSVEKAARLMKKENVGSIPVVDDKKTLKLIGIVTDRDLAINIIAEGLDPAGIDVSEVMSKGPVCCRWNEDIREVLDHMSEFQVRRIPVVDEDERIVGIIAQADVARQLRNVEVIGEVVKEISEE